MASCKRDGKKYLCAQLCESFDAKRLMEPQKIWINCSRKVKLEDINRKTKPNKSEYSTKDAGNSNKIHKEQRLVRIGTKKKSAEGRRQ